MTYIGCLALLMALVMIITTYWSGVTRRKVVKRVESLSPVGVASYSVYVDFVPVHQAEKKAVKKGAPQPAPIGADEVLGWMEERFGEVAEVQLTSDDKLLFKLLLKRGEALLQLKRERQKRVLGLPGGSRRRVAKAKRLILECDKAVTKLRGRKQFNSVGAFVTFTTEESRNYCLRELGGRLVPGWLRARSLNFRQVPIVAVPGEPPTNVKYKNLHIGGWQRFWRRQITLFAAILMILCSFVIVSEVRYHADFYAKRLTYHESAFTSQLGLTSDQLLNYGGDQAGNYGNPSVTTVSSTATCDSVMVSGKTIIENLETSRSQKMTQVYDSFTYQYAKMFNPVLTADAMNYPLTITDGDSALLIKAIKGSTDATVQKSLACYCLGLRGAYESVRRRNDRLRTGLVDACGSYVTADISLAALSLLGSLAIVILNFGISWAFKHLPKFCKFHTVTEENASRVVKQAIALWVNVSLVTLITSAMWGEAAVVTQSRYGGGSYLDFTPEWYEDTGLRVLITTGLAAIAPIPADYFLHVVLPWLGRKRRRANAIIQEDLNEAYLGPHLVMADQYAEWLAIFLTCCMYAAGMPFMWLILAVTTLCRSLFLRYMILRVYRSPPRFSEVLSATVMHLMMFGVGVFLFFSTWQISYFFTNSLAAGLISAQSYVDIQTSTTANASNENMYTLSRILQDNVAAMVILLVLLFLYYTLWKFVLRPVLYDAFLKGTLARCFSRLFCLKDHVDVGTGLDLNDALKLGTIHGVLSYAPVDQPMYKARFEMHIEVDLPEDEYPNSYFTRKEGDEGAEGASEENMTPLSDMSTYTVNEDGEEGDDLGATLLAANALEGYDTASEAGLTDDMGDIDMDDDEVARELEVPGVVARMDQEV